LGQTGNVYTIVISHVPSCTCPDHAKGNLCKHILFVLHRVLKVPRNSPLLFQQALLTEELHDIFTTADSIQTAISSDVLAERQVREVYQARTGDHNVILESTTTVDDKKKLISNRKDIDQDCPICFERMNEKEELIYCKAKCGNNMHLTCFQKWDEAQKAINENVTCPFCRVEWPADVVPKKATTSSGFHHRYLNLAEYSTAHTTAMDDDDEDDEDMYYTSSSYRNWRHYW